MWNDQNLSDKCFVLISKVLLIQIQAKTNHKKTMFWHLHDTIIKLKCKLNSENLSNITE